MSSGIMRQLKESVDYIHTKCDMRPQIGITLGSGLASFANEVDVQCEFSYAEIPHFSPPSVDGHPGKLVLGQLQGVNVAILQGRIHFYEGHTMEEVVYPTRVISQLGIEKLILTNAAGGLDPNMKPGDFMIIQDHINLTGNNPLIGPNITELGLRFPDMSETYDKKMREIATGILKKLDIRHSEGIYCGVTGPTYETAAEVRYLQKIGGHAVGMSTVPETIAAKHMGLRVFGISCISNLATGISQNPITHEEVKETTALVESSFSSFLKEFIPNC